MNTKDLFPETLPEDFTSNITMPHIQFGNIDIRQDEQGRYCLNDLHKAAGGANKHRPSLWLANKRAKALIAEFSRSAKQEFLLGPRNLEAGIPASNPSPVNSIRWHGITFTYVIKPLAYAYAAWVSPAFERFVYEVFDAVMSASVGQLQRESAALYTIRRRWKDIVDHPGMRRADLIKLTGHKSPGSITACRRRMREVGLIQQVVA